MTPPCHPILSAHTNNFLTVLGDNILSEGHGDKEEEIILLIYEESWPERYDMGGQMTKRRVVGGC